MLVGTLRRGSGMTGSGGVAEVAPVVGSERFCRSDALKCVLSRPLGAGFGTGTVCAVESVAAPATETAMVKANAARVLATANGSTGRNLEILVNARSWFASLAIYRASRPRGYRFSVKTSVSPRYRTVLFKICLTCWPSSPSQRLESTPA